jgi:hypothetical protein
MGHPGLLIQDYVAGIPIWYNPNRTHSFSDRTKTPNEKPTLPLDHALDAAHSAPPP